MSDFKGLATPHQPNWQGLVDNILRKGTPGRVYHMELFHDGEIRNAIAERFDLLAELPERHLMAGPFQQSGHVGHAVVESQLRFGGRI